MKGVQIGILALLVVIAALLGVIALQQAPTHPQPHEAAADEPAPMEMPRAELSSADPAPAPAPKPRPTAQAESKPAPAAAPAPAAKPAPPPVSAVEAAPAAAASAQESPPARQPARILKPETPAPQRRKVTLPAGYRLAVRLIDSVSTDANRAGDAFSASLAAPLVVDGVTIAEKNAQVDGRIVEVDRGGRVKGRANIALELVRLHAADGRQVELETESYALEAKSTVKRDAVKVGVLTGIGAAAGAIAGGARGARVGAVSGAGAGGGTVAATRGAAAVIPSETRLVFRLARPADFTAAP